jgi:hypothetical protein
MEVSVQDIDLNQPRQERPVFSTSAKAEQEI